VAQPLVCNVHAKVTVDGRVRKGVERLAAEELSDSSGTGQVDDLEWPSSYVRGDPRATAVGGV